jgi:hypothetical protein
MSHVPARPDKDREPWAAKFIAWMIVAALALCICAGLLLFMRLLLGACNRNV